MEYKEMESIHSELSSNSTNSAVSVGSTDSKKEERKKRKEQKKKDKLKKQCPFEFQKDTEEFIINIDITEEEEKIIEKVENGVELTEEEEVVYNSFAERSNPSEILKQELKDYVSQFIEIRKQMEIDSGSV